MALGITGHGGFISQPLAIVVIGGLVSSTVLTLVVLPTLYNLVEGARERRRARKAGPDSGASEAGSPAPVGPSAPVAAGVEPVGAAVGAGVEISGAEISGADGHPLTRRELRDRDRG